MSDERGDYPTEGDIERMALRNERNQLRAAVTMLEEILSQDLSPARRVEQALAKIQEWKDHSRGRGE